MVDGGLELVCSSVPGGEVGEKFFFFVFGAKSFLFMENCVVRYHTLVVVPEAEQTSISLLNFHLAHSINNNIELEYPILGSI